MSKGYSLKLGNEQLPPDVRPPEYVIEKDGKEMVRGTPVTLIFFAYMRMEEMAAQLEEAFKQINQMQNDLNALGRRVYSELDGRDDDLANIERDIARNHD